MQTDVDAALLRVVTGYRVVGALWLAVLAVLALLQDGDRPPVIIATVVLATVWTAATVARSLARPDSVRTWAWLAADLAVSAWTLLAPSAAGVADIAFYGGYPFATVLLAAYARGALGGGVAALVLSAVSVVRLVGGGRGLPAVPEAVGTVLLYVVGAAVVAWGADMIRRFDADRRQAQARLAEERAERERSQERAETAAHLHDSVLQTLALIQRRSGDSGEVTALARQQERALRSWLSGERTDSPASFAAAVRAAAAEVEQLHRVTVDVVTVGDHDVHEALRATVAAAREAMANAAEHAGVERVDCYAEVAEGGVVLFVRDRGSGFDPQAVAGDRRGIRDSIVGRMQRVGGSATVRSAPGRGTEVALRMPLEPAAVFRHDPGVP